MFSSGTQPWKSYAYEKRRNDLVSPLKEYPGEIKERPHEFCFQPTIALLF